MKNKILLLLALTLTSALYSEKKYDETFVRTVKIGDKEGEIGYLFDTAYENTPSGISFNKEGEFVWGDLVNGRIQYFDENFKFKRAVEVPGMLSTAILTETDDILWGSLYNVRILALNKKNGKSIDFSIGDQYVSKHYKPYFTDQVVFVYLEGGKLASLILEDKENLKFSPLLNSEQTRELFNNKSLYGLEEYHIDDKDRIFKNGKLAMMDYKVWYEYWDEIHKKNNETPPELVPGIPSYDILKKIDCSYHGSDKDGNTYWYISNGVLVFNPHGWLIDYFIFKKRSFMAFAINSEGDVFFYLVEKIDEERVINIYKVERKW